jgi:hypothetical protein
MAGPKPHDYRSLRNLDERELLLPMEPRMSPKRDVLAWRLERLRDSEWMPPGRTAQWEKNHSSASRHENIRLHL